MRGAGRSKVSRSANRCALLQLEPHWNLKTTPDPPAQTQTQVRTFINKIMFRYFYLVKYCFFLDSNCIGYEERCETRIQSGVPQQECKQVCVKAPVVGIPLEFEDNSKPSSEYPCLVYNCMCSLDNESRWWRPE